LSDRARNYIKGIEINGFVLIGYHYKVLEEMAKERGVEKFNIEQKWQGLSFERMLLKIAYGFSVAYYGIASFDEVFILPAILGKKEDVGMWLGCDQKKELNLPTVPIDPLYSIGLIKNDKNVLIVSIRLFSPLAPEYYVVVGRLKPNAQALL
jgi:hypothetical protein